MIEQAVSFVRDKLKKDYNEAFGKVMNRRRSKAGLTQKELGEYIGVDKSTISRYEKGLMEMPASTLPLTCEACDFKMTDYVASVDDIITEKKLLEIYKIKERATTPKEVSVIEEEHYTEAEKQLVDLSYDYLLKVEQMRTSEESLAFSVDLVFESMQQKSSAVQTYARLLRYMNLADNLKKPVAKD